MVVLVNVIMTVGMLVVVPIGLRLIDLSDAVRHTWTGGAILGATSLWLPRGSLAVMCAVVYALASLILAAQAPRRLLRAGARRAGWPTETAVLSALVMPAVAGSALVSERAGVELFGFSLEILSLTVAHFHYAGFAAALIAGLVCRSAGSGVAASVAALSVPAGTLLVLAGYFTGEWVEFTGAVVLTGGMWLVGWLTWRRIHPDRREVRALLVTSATVLTVTMALALSWALGEASGLPHLPLWAMVATHGTGNAFGFGLCGMVAWRLLKEDAV